MRLIDKQKAVILRKKGFSYKEIITVIPNLSKSTLSGWCIGIELTDKQLEKIRERAKTNSERGRVNAGIIKRNQRLQREKNISEIARQDFLIFKNDSFFICGLALYWAEGSKKSKNFQFMNSDPALIKLMLQWIEKYLKTDKIKPRLYTHDIFKSENHELFWSDILNIPKDNFSKTVYKSTPHVLKKNLEYKGCLRLELTRTEPWLIVMEWIKLYKEYMRL